MIDPRVKRVSPARCLCQELHSCNLSHNYSSSRVRLEGCRPGERSTRRSPGDVGASRGMDSIRGAVVPSIADRNHRASLIGNARLGHWEPRRRQMVLTAAEKRRISEHIVVDRRTGCWLWDGISDRYGEISFRGIPTKAHRLMLQLLLDEALPIDAHVHHECERRGCVNPDHLRLLKPGDHRKRHTAGVGRRS